MDKHEMFSLIFYAIETYYENGHKTEELEDLLSELNPFLWGDRSSADPAYFTDLCEMISDDDIPIEGSYALARSY